MFSARRLLALGLAFAFVACGSPGPETGQKSIQTQGNPPRTTTPNGAMPMAPMDPVEPEDDVSPIHPAPTGATGTTGATGETGATGPTGVVEPAITVVRVHYPSVAAVVLRDSNGNPTGGSGVIQLRGSVAPLTWAASSSGRLSGDVATFELDIPAGTSLEFKPVVESGTKWAIGSNYKVQGGKAVDVYPHFFVSTGKVITWNASFHSNTLGNNRKVSAYLPAGYDENTVGRYPVLYMHDGPNLFNAAESYAGEWKVDETLNAGNNSNDGGIREIIVIGVAPVDRMAEYTPTSTAQYGGGDAVDYIYMLSNELIPAVNNGLRTLTGPENTGMMGSSLGGLISVYASVHAAGTFGIIGAMSPSTWWDNKWIIGDVNTNLSATTRAQKVYIDHGTSGDDAVNTAALVQTFKNKGYTEGTTLHYVVEQNASHAEAFWAGRLPAALRYMFPN